MKYCCILHGRVFVINCMWQAQRVQRRMVLVVIFFLFFEIIIFWFVLAIFEVVHDVEVIHGLFYLLRASGNLH